MQNWLHYFFLSFFSDTYTHEAHKRSLLNGFGCFFLSLAILLGLLFGGYLLAMPAHYRDTCTYRQALYAALGDPRRIVKVENGTLSVSDLQNVPAVIAPTAPSDEDCLIILDTRDIRNTFVAFTVSYIGKDGSELSYETYLALDDAEKSDYVFSVQYSDVPICFTQALLASYEQYLSTVTDEAIQSRYAELLASKQDTDAYALALYELYVSAYYPAEVAALDLYAFAPTLRTYYDDLVAQAGSRPFFVMYDDFVYSRFYGAGDIVYTVSAPASQLDDQLLSCADEAETQLCIDRFLCHAFRATSNTIVIEYIFNFIRLSSLLILGGLLLTVLTWLLFKTTKNHKYAAYLTSLQILLLYTPMAAVVGGVVGFVLSWFAGRGTAYRVAVMCYAAVASCRMILYTLRTLLRERNA